MEERVAAPVLSRGDVTKYWLLNLAIECPIPLMVLFPSFRWPTRNAREIPNVQAEDFARNLLELFDSGMIAVSSELPEDNTSTRSGLSLILDRFLALPQDSQQLRHSDPGRHLRPRSKPNAALQVNFELTTCGGDVWERVAQPDWSRLLIEKSDFEVADFYSANRDLLTAYMGWYEEINEARILSDTVEWRRYTDFEIVYWKRLPAVHHAFCRLEVKPPTNTPKWLWDWYTSATNWYTKPWELPDWPSE